MAATRINVVLATAAALVVLFSPGTCLANPLTIYDIQYVDSTADPTGASPYNGATVDCTGGIVVFIDSGSRPRLFLQDPGYLDGWGAIQVKGWNGSETFAGVNVGDRVSLTDVYVEEFRGTTFLQFGADGQAPNAAITIESSGNPVPGPMVVTLDQIAAPLEGPPDQWYVTDHSAEPYESMRLTVEDVIVSDMYLGKAGDNYNLHNADGDAWASDYINVDKDPDDLYHPYVGTGAESLSVTGMLEQYERRTSGWDYYQLLTTSTDDFVLVPEPAACVMLLTTTACLAGWTLLRRRRL
jgi:hypothetical protein